MQNTHTNPQLLFETRHLYISLWLVCTPWCMSYTTKILLSVTYFFFGSCNLYLKKLPFQQKETSSTSKTNYQNTGVNRSRVINRMLRSYISLLSWRSAVIKGSTLRKMNNCFSTKKKKKIQSISSV